jgi:hypothetical protein
VPETASDDRSTWRQLPGDLKAAKRDRAQAQILTERVRGVLDGLLGHRSHPWLMALTGQASSPGDRIAAFMDRETMVEDVPLRVVELTGEPGDMVFCHPVMVHCVAPNRVSRPRFMRIKTQVLTPAGREPRDRLYRPDS